MSSLSSISKIFFSVSEALCPPIYGYQTVLITIWRREGKHVSGSSFLILSPQPDRLFLQFQILEIQRKTNFLRVIQNHQFANIQALKVVIFSVGNVRLSLFWLVIHKEAKFERGAAQAGPGIGLDFPLPLLQCTHTNQCGWNLGLQKQLTFKQLKSFFREAL